MRGLLEPTLEDDATSTTLEDVTGDGLSGKGGGMDG